MAEKIDRRRFLVTGASALAAAAGLGGFVSLAFLRPWAADRVGQAVLVGYPEDIPADSVLVMRDAKVALGRTEAGFFALSTVCPHLSCVVRWLEPEGRFHCPCHGSKFEREGRVLNGPAHRDLPPLEIGLDGLGRLVVEPPAARD